MSFNGSGVFAINTTGQPVVSGTTISAAVFNAFTADVATGLSTAMLKDGTQTATAGIGFYAGTVSLPGIYFGTDTATGLYRIGLNNYGYAVNGTKLLDMTGTTLAVTSTITANTIGVTSGTTATVFNATATTVNAFGAATTLNLGAATGTLTVANTTLAAKAGTFSTTLGVTGTSTLATVNATVSGTVLTAYNSSAADAAGSLVALLRGEISELAGTGPYIQFTSNGSNVLGKIWAAYQTGNASDIVFQTYNSGTPFTALRLGNAGVVTIPGTTINMTTSGTTLTVGVGADNGTVSAGVFTDRTKHFDGDALSELALVVGKDGEIDHDTLPAFVRTIVKRPIMGDVEHDVEKEVDGEMVIERVTERKQVGEEDAVERDLGAMISMLTVAVQQISARITTLESAK